MSAAGAAPRASQEDASLAFRVPGYKSLAGIDDHPVLGFCEQLQRDSLEHGLGGAEPETEAHKYCSNRKMTCGQQSLGKITQECIYQYAAAMQRNLAIMAKGSRNLPAARRPEEQAVTKTLYWSYFCHFNS